MTRLTFLGLMAFIFPALALAEPTLVCSMIQDQGASIETKIIEEKLIFRPISPTRNQSLTKISFTDGEEFNLEVKISEELLSTGFSWKSSFVVKSNTGTVLANKLTEEEQALEFDLGGTKYYIKCGAYNQYVKDESAPATAIEKAREQYLDGPALHQRFGSVGIQREDELPWANIWGLYQLLRANSPLLQAAESAVIESGAKPFLGVYTLHALSMGQLEACATAAPAGRTCEEVVIFREFVVHRAAFVMLKVKAEIYRNSSGKIVQLRVREVSTDYMNEGFGAGTSSTSGDKLRDR